MRTYLNTDTCGLSPTMLTNCDHWCCIFQYALSRSHPLSSEIRLHPRCPRVVVQIFQPGIVSVREASRFAEPSRPPNSAWAFDSLHKLLIGPIWPNYTVSIRHGCSINSTAFNHWLLRLIEPQVVDMFSGCHPVFCIVSWLCYSRSVSCIDCVKM